MSSYNLPGGFPGIAGSYPTNFSGDPSGAHNAAGTKPPRKRKNHNETEKRRRNLQRQRLEELRDMIPGLFSNKTSTVSVLVKAKEYIHVLRTRITELEAARNHTVSSLTTAPIPQMMNNNTNMSYPLIIGGNNQVTGLTPVTAFIPQPIASNVLIQPMPSLSSTQVSPPRNKAPDVRLLPKPPGMRRSKSPLGISEDKPMLDHFSRKPSASNVFDRRDSSLLFPTSDPNTLLFGKRDSLQTLFATTISSMFDPITETEPIRCAKCTRTVDNLIMIDCDKCRRWYHIRCIGIETTTIPVRWSCAECEPKELLLESSK